MGRDKDKRLSLGRWERVVHEGSWVIIEYWEESI